ncbi:MAG: 50S ribosomal protein L19e [Candidatus Nanohaloarchaea archaeon]
MDLSTQKRLAAEIMDIGKDRVWIDPDEQEKVDEAITRQDIRNLIEGGTIQKKDQEGNSKARSKQNKKQKKKGRQKNDGSKSGSKNARKDSKQEWMENIRAIRDKLKDLRENDTINQEQYRKLYNMANGGFFRNTKHLQNYIENKLGE